MAQVGFKGGASLGYIGDAPESGSSSFSLQNPAGWWAIWWGLSVLIIIAMFLAL